MAASNWVYDGHKLYIGTSYSAPLVAGTLATGMALVNKTDNKLKPIDLVKLANQSASNLTTKEFIKPGDLHITSAPESVSEIPILKSDCFFAHFLMIYASAAYRMIPANEMQRLKTEERCIF